LERLPTVLDDFAAFFTAAADIDRKLGTAAVDADGAIGTTQITTTQQMLATIPTPG
jgi:hypothetical protein